MKALLIFCLVGLTMAEYGFVTKKEYVYDYNMKLVTAIPGLKNQGSGMALHAQLVIQTISASSYMCQLKNPQIANYQNTKVPLPWEQVPEPHYSPVPSKYTNFVESPFVVEVSHGTVRRIELGSADPEWIANMKKAVVSLIQVNMKQQSSVHNAFINRLRAPTQKPEAHFHVREEGIAGDCDTIYEVVPVPQFMKVREMSKLKAPQLVPNSAKLFKVIKTKNFEDCKKNPVFQHMTPPADSCSPGWTDCQGHAANRSAVAEYLLSGDISHFRIHRCENKGVLLINPYGHNTEQLMAFSDQTLNLISVNIINHPLTPPRAKRSLDSLVFLYPSTSRQHHPGYPLPHPDPTSAPDISYTLPGSPIREIHAALPFSAIKSQIQHIMHDLAANFAQIPNPEKVDIPGRVLELRRAMDMLSLDQLRQCYADYAGNGQDNESKRAIFMDVSAITGTNAAFMFLKHEFVHGKLTTEQISGLIAVLPMHIKTPTKQIIDQFYQVINSNAITQHRQTHITGAFAFANLLRLACIKPHLQQQTFPAAIYGQMCPPNDPDVKGKYIQYFIQAADRVSDIFEKAAYIQALSNTGSPEIIHVISPYITGRKTGNSILRSQAIYALNRVDDLHMVLEVVAPIFFNQGEDERVRLAALTMMMHSNPSLAYLERIALSTWEEPSEQVVSYFYTTIRSLANVTTPEMPNLFKMSLKARSVLPLVKAPVSGYAYTHNLYYADIIKSWQKGSALKATWYGYENSSLPYASYVELNEYINGYVYSPFRMAMDISNPQAMLDAIMTPSKDIRQRRSVRDFQPNNVEHQMVSSHLKIDEKLWDQEDPRAKIYVQIMGLIDRQFVLENASIDRLHQQIRDANSYTNVQKAVNLADITVSFPSETGLAVTYKMDFPIVASVRGTLTINSNSWREANVKLDARPYADAKMLSSIGFVEPFSLQYFASGAENHMMASFPAIANVSYSIPDRTFASKITIVPSSHSPKTVLGHLKTAPFTTAKPVSQFTPLSESIHTKVVHVKQPEENEYKFGQDYFGMDLSFSVKSEYTFNDFASYYNRYRETGLISYPTSLFQMHSLKYHTYQLHLDTASSQTHFVYFKFAIDDTATNSPPRTPSEPLMEMARKASLVKLQQASRQVKSGEGYVVTVLAGLHGNYQRDYKMTIGQVHSPDSEETRTLLDYTCARCSRDYRKICVDSSIKFPPGPSMIESQQQILSSTSSFPARIDVKWGSNCETDKNIHIEGNFQHKPESIAAVRASKVAQQCARDERRGIKLSAACIEAKLQLAMYDKAVFKFKYNNLTPYFMNYTRRAEDLLKYILFPQLSIDDYNIHNPQSELSLTSDYNRVKNSVDFLLKKPTENTWYHQVPLPTFTVTYLWPISSHVSLNKVMKEKILGPSQDQCILEGSEITTFDNVKLSSQLGDCYYLLAKDCTQKSQIAILAKKMRTQSQKKSVKILVDNDKVELIPQRNQVLVKVNGVNIPYESLPKDLSSSSQPTLIKYQGQVKAKISRQGAKSILVKMPEHSAELVTDGKTIILQMSPLYYKNKVCGLCGDMNGEKSLEMKDALMCIKSSPESFANSYAIPDSSCRLPQSPSIPEPCVKVVKGPNAI